MPASRPGTRATDPGPAALPTLPVRELLRKNAPYNPRVIDEDDLSKLEESLRAFGCVEPIVVNRSTDRIVGGHQRVKAAGRLGLEELPVFYVELGEAEERQLNVALNKITGRWDYHGLAAVFADLQAAGADLAVTGFDKAEVDEIMESIVPPPAEPPPSFPTVDDDIATDHKCPRCSYEWSGACK